MEEIKMAIDQQKLDKMWKKILEYEKKEGVISSNKKIHVSKIVKIITEVYDECY